MTISSLNLSYCAWSNQSRLLKKSKSPFDDKLKGVNRRQDYSLRQHEELGHGRNKHFKCTALFVMVVSPKNLHEDNIPMFLFWGGNTFYLAKLESNQIISSANNW